MPALLWFILYGVFLFDATVTLSRRLLAKERWYEAHRLHAYQRLHQSGWSHRRVVCGLVLINTLLALIAVLCFYWKNLLFLGIVAAFFLLLGVYLYIERRKPMY